MTTIIKFLGVIILFILITSCEKDDNTGNMFFGTWVSEDKVDTLRFLDNQTFKKSYHTFLYSRDIRNITIQYSGPAYILVMPTTHYYKLHNEKLIIDFTDGCYGFRSEVISFIKQ